MGDTLSVGELAQLLGLLLVVLVFIVLLVVGIGTAAEKGHFWVPGNVLLLSALTIQLMNFVEDRSSLLNAAVPGQTLNCTNVSKVQFVINSMEVQSALPDQNSRPLMAAKGNQTDAERSRSVMEAHVFNHTLLMVHCSRVMLCVLIAFFLPGMARPGHENTWTTVAAILFTVLLHIFSELSIIHHNSATANKGIQSVILQKIPLILGNPENSWKAVEDQVLKSWIVARAFNPEYIIGNSELASSAALAVTVCVVLSILTWIAQGADIDILGGTRFWLKFIIIIVEVLFILIGAAIIVWRWLLSVAYYGPQPDNFPEDSCAVIKFWETFQVEDYWTRHIVELQETEESSKVICFPDYDDKNENKKEYRKAINRFWKVITKKAPSLFLQGVLWLEFYVVCLVALYSKLHWFLSWRVFSSKLVRSIAEMILSKHWRKVAEEFKGYEAVLKWDVRVISETPMSVFIANRNPIKQTKAYMEKGNDAGRSCNALISFLEHRRPGTGVAIWPLHPGTAHDRTGLKFLWRRYSVPPLEEEKYFLYSSNWPWKLTAVSLIDLISQLGVASCSIHGCSCERDYLIKVYEEAWELMNLVEESDPEIDLLRKAADTQFVTLRKQSAQNSKAKTMQEAASKIEEIANRTKIEVQKVPKKGNGKEALVDLEKLAAGITLYKICTSIDCSSGDLMELVKELHSTLAEVIGTCIDQVAVKLVETSRKWAGEMDETKLLQAVYIAGKSSGLMEKLLWSPNVPVVYSNVPIAPETEERGRHSTVLNAPPRQEVEMDVEMV
eukprot:PITA_15566